MIPNDKILSQFIKTFLKKKGFNYDEIFWNETVNNEKVLYRLEIVADIPDEMILELRQKIETKYGKTHETTVVKSTLIDVTID